MDKIFNLTDSEENSRINLMSSENFDIIAEDLLETLRETFIFPANIVLTSIGVATNVVNTIVQFKLGLNNSMSLGIFALSLTDMLVTFLQLVISVCYVLDKVYPECSIDFWAVGVFIFSWVRYLCFFVSGWITTAISVERCFCVVSPFNVKAVFTRGRSIAVIVLIYAVHIGLVVPIYAVQKLMWTQVGLELENRTSKSTFEFTIVFTEEFINIQVVLNNVYAIALSVTSQVIIIICTCWMIYSLKWSARVRNSTECQNQQLVDSHIISPLSSRERRMVKVVLGLVILLTSCNIPRYAIICTYYSLPGMKYGSYKNFSDFLWDISDLLSIISCSSNFFVYFILNVNFKKCLLSMCKSNLNRQGGIHHFIQTHKPKIPIK